MLRIGKVIAYHNGMCTIEFTRLESCKTCGQCKHAQDNLTIEMNGDYAVGDYVSIYLPDNQFLKAASIAYLLPLFGLMLGLFLGSNLTGGQQDAITILCGALGLALPLLGIWLREKLRKTRPSWEPYIKEKVYNFGTMPTELIQNCIITSKEK